MCTVEMIKSLFVIVYSTRFEMDVMLLLSLSSNNSESLPGRIEY